MKNNRVVDERIEQVSNKYLAQSAGIAMGIALISMFIKCAILEMPFTSYMMEIIIFLVPSLYYLIRIIASGIMPFAVKNDKEEKQKRKAPLAIASIFFGVMMAFTVVIPQFQNHFGYLAIIKFVFVSVFGAITWGVTVYQLENWMNRIAAKKMDKALENQEEKE